MKTRICECCGAFFEQDSPNQKYCSIRCRRFIENKEAYTAKLEDKLAGMRTALEGMTNPSPARRQHEYKIMRAEATLAANKAFLLNYYDQRGLDGSERTEQDSYMPEDQRMLRRNEVARRCGCLSPQNN